MQFGIICDNVEYMYIMGESSNFPDLTALDDVMISVAVPEPATIILIALIFDTK